MSERCWLLPAVSGLPADVWHIDLSDGYAKTDATAVLSADELDRMASMATETLARRYAVAHAALRYILAAYAGVEPAKLRIVRAPCPRCGAAHGKPALAFSPTRFSLSHSDDHALVAVSAAEVGVDVEFTGGAPVDLDGVIALATTPLERRLLMCMPARERWQWFRRLWVRKEAIMKASGRGLTLAPNLIEVAAGSLAIVPTFVDCDGAWAAVDLPLAPPLVGAAAVRTQAP